ncbi:MAG: helix-turn-helix domain-containing protein [Anaerolineales bacterium]|nr:helix-turn-helix domain-containing protein [Anaerolineales bacterium]
MDGSKQQDPWLTLSSAAKILGVHPSTVRLWSDKNRLPVHRTVGGHRRYKRSEIELWAENARQHEDIEPGNAMQTAVRQIRVRIAEGSLEAEGWYQKLDEEARLQYRKSGKILLQGLMTYLASDGQEAQTEAYALGYEYASRAHRYALDSSEATQAFLFFRNILLDSIIKVYQDAHIPCSEAWGKTIRKANAFTDQILLHLLETYQALERKHPCPQ